MKKRYIFIKDADISPMGYGQTAPANKKKHFKKGDVVWGEVYPNAIRESEPPIQGLALHVPIDGADVSEGWDVPLPPLSDSPVRRYPIITMKNAIITAIIIVGIKGIYDILKYKKII